MESIITKACEIISAEVGPGLPETAYSKCLAIHLRALGFQVDTEYAINVRFRNERVCVIYADLVILDDEGVPVHVIEMKTKASKSARDHHQLSAYKKYIGADVGTTLVYISHAVGMEFHGIVTTQSDGSP